MWSGGGGGLVVVAATPNYTSGWLPLIGGSMYVYVKHSPYTSPDQGKPA